MKRKNYYLLRPSPGNINRMKEWLKENIVAIGWSNLKEEIKKGNLEEINANGYTKSTLIGFIKEMEIGDILIIPNGDDIHFAEITSDYYFNDKLLEKEDYNNQRKVKYFNLKKREDMPMEIRKILKTRHTLARLTKYRDLLDDFLSGKKIIQREYETIELPIGRDGIKITITMPKDLTRLEAEKLGNTIKTLYFID